MTDTIAHPPLPEPAGHTFPSILEALAKVVCHGHIYSLPQSDPVYGSTVPLYTAQQMREYRDAPAWLPIETAPKHTEVLCWREDQGVFISQLTEAGEVMSTEDLERSDIDPDFTAWFNEAWGWQEGSEVPTHWMPLPSAPIEQATGEKP